MKNSRNQREVGKFRFVVKKARGLPVGTTFDKNDPYVKITFGHHHFRTETDEDGGATPNWDFARTVPVMDHETAEIMKFKIYDEDRGRDDFLGSFEISIDGFVAQPGVRLGQWFKLKEKHGGERGEIKIEGSYHPHGTLKFTLVEARGLKGSFFGKNDPYVKGEYINHRFRTKTHKRGGKKPFWDHSEILHVNELDMKQMIDLKVMDKDLNKDDWLAEILLPISSFTELSDMDQWIKFDEGKGELHIITHYDAADDKTL